MRKVLAMAIAAVVALVALPATASAAQVCQARAQWTVDWPAGSATISVDESTATGAGCSTLLPADGTQYVWVGAWATGVHPMIAVESIGFENIPPREEQGFFKVTGGDLDAVLHTKTADGADTLEAYDGDGSMCGASCYRTKGVFTAP